MMGLVFHTPGDLRLERVADPELPDGGLKVRVTYAGVCGTDVRILNGKKIVAGPRIIGHEFIGEVVESSSAEWAGHVGARVAVYPVVACGICAPCLHGRKNICIRRQTFGYELDGGFAELVSVPRAAVDGGNVIALDPSLSDEEAIMSEPAAAVLHGIRRASIRPGDTVFISGGGPIGLLHASLARLNGADTVVVAEPQTARRERALTRGVDAVFAPESGRLKEQILEATGGRGADVAIIAAGLPALVGELPAALNKGARCLVFAGMPPGSTSLIDPNVVHYGEVDIIGSSGSTPEIQRDVLGLMVSGQLRARDLVSDVFTLDEWSNAFGQNGSTPGMKAIFAIGAS